MHLKLKIFTSLLLIFNGVHYGQNTVDTFQNPILPGFNPDPSICAVGEDFYLVTSSFEWFPGLPIYHSKDLTNWELIGYGLSQENTMTIPKEVNNSRGVYAPTIRYHNGTFYIINTCIECGGNFYITAKNPRGPWSQPVWLDAPGIDPSLFWDDDGSCYYTGNENVGDDKEWEGQSFIWIQELDLKKKALVGERKKLTYGHAINARWTEGAHLYKINGTYLLMVAEGGTSFHHATTVFYSDSIFGPYEAEQANPVFTHRFLGKDYPIWAVGHTDLVQTGNKDWWAVLHAKKKINGYSIIGRETYLVPVSFEGKRPVFNSGIGILQEKMKRPDLRLHPFKTKANRDAFNDQTLGLEWNFLKSPKTKWHRLSGGKLILDILPGEVDKKELISLIAKRVLDHNFKASTAMEFASKKSNEKAGIILYRSSDSHYQLVKSAHEIQLIKTFGKEKEMVAKIPYNGTTVQLRIEGDGKNKAQFSFSRDGIAFQKIGNPQDLSGLGDETALRFNGLMIGIYATSQGAPSKSKVSFDWFGYE